MAAPPSLACCPATSLAGGAALSYDQLAACPGRRPGEPTRPAAANWVHARIEKLAGRLPAQSKIPVGGTLDRQLEAVGRAQYLCGQGMMEEVVVPRLETERLLLRKVATEDLDEWAQATFADQDVVRYMPSRDMTPRERAERAMKIFDENWMKNGYGGWLVTDKATGSILGECNLDAEELGDVELGYSFRKDSWGKGYATEAARAAVRFGFEKAGLKRIVAVVVPENTASWKILEKLGFTFDRKARAYNLDVAYYAMSRDQFRSDNSFYRVTY